MTFCIALRRRNRQYHSERQARLGGMVGIFRRAKQGHGFPAVQPVASTSPEQPGATAQELFSQMMKSSVGPALRDLGFKGSGQTFSIPSETHYALLGFQKSVYSNADAVRVTVNVCVVRIDAWNEVREERAYLPDKPTPNTFYGDFAWQKRIGELMPTGVDTWWDVEAGQDTATVASDIVRAVQTFAVPAMRQQLAST